MKIKYTIGKLPNKAIEDAINKKLVAYVIVNSTFIIATFGVNKTTLKEILKGKL
jgi:hypothetical protein